MSVILVVAALACLIWLWRARRKGSAKPRKHLRTATSGFDKLDPWIRESLGHMLSTVVPHAATTDDASGAKSMYHALSGDPDPDVVSALEEAVDHIDVEFHQIDESSAENTVNSSGASRTMIDVAIFVTYADGLRIKETTRRDPSEIPQDIRRDLARKPRVAARRRYHFPWSRHS